MHGENGFFLQIRFFRVMRWLLTRSEYFMGCPSNTIFSYFLASSSLAEMMIGWFCAVLAYFLSHCTFSLFEPGWKDTQIFDHVDTRRQEMRKMTIDSKAKCPNRTIGQHTIGDIFSARMSKTLFRPLTCDFALDKRAKTNPILQLEQSPNCRARRKENRNRNSSPNFT